MKRMLVAILATVIFSGCQTQTETNVLAEKKVVQPAVPKETEEQRRHREYVSRIKEEASLEAVKLKIAPAPASLPSTENDYDWRDTLALGLKYWQSEPRTYNTERSFLSRRTMMGLSSFREAEGLRKEFRNDQAQILTAYGLLQYGNNPIDHAALRKSALATFSDQRIRNTVYRWAIPSVRRAFKRMPSQDRLGYLDVLRHASVYLDSFDAEREDAYYRSLEDSKSGCRSAAWQKKYYKLPKWMREQAGMGSSCSYLFTYFGPGGEETPYRKIETFIYRRTKDGLRREDMKEILDRVIADLAPLA